MGYYWSEDGGRSYPFRGQGITVPTVEEVFSAFPEMRINIDIKQVRPSVADQFCRLILDFGMVERVMVASSWQKGADGCGNATAILSPLPPLAYMQQPVTK